MSVSTAGAPGAAVRGSIFPAVPPFRLMSPAAAWALAATIVFELWVGWYFGFTLQSSLAFWLLGGLTLLLLLRPGDHVVIGDDVCPGGFACQIRNDWLGTARGRIGYAFNQFLPYFTGGLAVGNLNASIPGVGSSSNTNTGWTIGAGVEVALTRNWSVKAEYLYVDLGSFDCTGCGTAPPGVGLTTNVVRGGVNFRF